MNQQQFEEFMAARHSCANVLALHPDPLVRAGIAACLRQHGGFEVFEEERDRLNREGVRFDVVIADYRQAMRLAGAAVTRGIVQERTQFPASGFPSRAPRVEPVSQPA